MQLSCSISHHIDIICWAWHFSGLCWHVSFMDWAGPPSLPCFVHGILGVTFQQTLVYCTYWWTLQFFYLKNCPPWVITFVWCFSFLDWVLQIGSFQCDVCALTVSSGWHFGFCNAIDWEWSHQASHQESDKQCFLPSHHWIPSNSHWLPHPWISWMNCPLSKRPLGVMQTPLGHGSWVLQSSVWPHSGDEEQCFCLHSGCGSLWFPGCSDSWHFPITGCWAGFRKWHVELDPWKADITESLDTIRRLGDKSSGCWTWVAKYMSKMLHTSVPSSCGPVPDSGGYTSPRIPAATACIWCPIIAAAMSAYWKLSPPPCIPGCTLEMEKHGCFFITSQHPQLASYPR